MKKLTPEQKEKLKKFAGNVDKAMNAVESQYESKMKPKVKGYELPLILSLVALTLGGLTPKGAALAVVVFAFTSAPRWVKKMLDKEGQTSTKKKVAKKEDKEEK